MTSVNVTTTKNTVTVNGETRVVTVKTRGPQGPSLPDGDKGDVTVSSNGTAISINNNAVTSAKIADGAIVNADINASAAIALSKLATGALPTAITVTSANISDLSIVDADISGSAAISLSKLATGALPTAITVTSANISDLSIVNADINASAAIAGTKIDPSFTSNVTISNTAPQLNLIDSNNNSDYQLLLEGGTFNIRDTTNSVNRLRINSVGTIETTGLLNATNALQVTGNITVSGTVDGRDVATDGTKLDGIETGATADQTASEIKTAYESNSDTNAFTDADHSKLDGIESGATADQTKADIDALGIAASTATTLATARTIAGTSFDGSANIDISYTNLTNKLSVGDGGLTQNNFTNALKTKLDGIETAATADQTAAEIKTLLDSNGIVNSNVDASAAIAGTKISPDFGSQVITTLGGITGGGLTSTSNININNDSPSLTFNDTNSENDFRLTNSHGTFVLFDNDAGATRMSCTSAGQFTFATNVDFSSGIDVTGNITATGTVDGVDIATRDTLFGGLTSSSGVLTNGVTATTQSASDNSTKVATTAYTDTAIANLVDSAPGTLNTLNELAAALGDDANFSTTVTNSIATKLPLAGGTLTGDLTISNTAPSLYFTDTNHDSDFRVMNQNGVFKIFDQTNSADRLEIYSGGQVVIDGNLDVGSGLDITGNITVTGTVDGRDLATDGTKLDGIESNATADQTASEIVALVADQTIAPSEIDMEDNEKIKLGTGDDLELYHTGNNSIIDNKTGDLFLRTTGSGDDVFIQAVDDILLQPQGSEDGIKVIGNGGVELYFDNVKKFEAKAGGIRVLNTGFSNVSAEFHDSSGIAGYIWGTGTNFGLLDKSGDYGIRLYNDAQVELYHNGVAKFETSNDGVDIDNVIKLHASAVNQAESGRIRFAEVQSTMQGAFIHYDGNANELHIGTHESNTTNSADDFNALTFSRSNGFAQFHADVTFTGATSGYNAVWDKSDNALEFADNAKAIFGTGSDLEIYHDGSQSYLKDFSNQLNVRADNAIKFATSNGSETYAKFIQNGAVELYYDNSKKLQTTSNGIYVTGNVFLPDSSTTNDGRIIFGASSDMSLYHYGGANYIDIQNTLNIRGPSSGGATINIKPLQSENGISVIPDGAVELYYDNSKKLETTTNGTEITGKLQVLSNGATASSIDGTVDIRAVGGSALLVGSTDASGAIIKIDGGANGDGANGDYVRIRHMSNGVCYFDNLHTAREITFRQRGEVERLKITSTGHIEIPADNALLRIGASADLQIYHDGNDSIITNSTGNLVLRNTSGDAGVIGLQPKSGENAIICRDDNNVELYFDNSKKLETTSTGVTVTGKLTATDEIISQDDIRIQSTYPRLYLTDTDSNDDFSLINNNGSFLIYNDTQNAFRLKIDGTTGQCAMNLRPTADSTFDLGTNTLRWANVYADTLYGDGSNLTNITATADLVTDTSPQLGGALDTNGNNITFADNVRIVMGDAGINDSHIRWDTSVLHLGATGSGIRMSCAGLQVNNYAGTEKFLRAIDNGAVELYYDNSKKLETTSSGVTVTGGVTASAFAVGDNQEIKLGDGNDLKLFHNGNHSYIADLGTGDLRITGSAIHLQNAAQSENMIRSFENGAVELYYDNSKKFETLTNGVHITGTTFLDDSSRDDGFKAKFGTGDDLQIYHDGSNSYMDDAGTGALNIRTNNSNINFKGAGSFAHDLAIFKSTEGVELYYDNTKRFETTSSGITVAGNGVFTGNLQVNDNNFINIGNSGDLQLSHDGTNNFIDFGSGELRIRAMSGDDDNCIIAKNDGAVELYHDNVKRFETDSTGVRVVAPEGEQAMLRLIGDEGDDNNDYFRLNAGGGTLKIQDASNGSSWEDNIVINAASSVELYYDNSKKFETTSGGGTLTGDWSVTNDFFWFDNGEAVFGTGGDLKISHDGTNSTINSQTGNLRIRNAGTLSITKGSSENMALFIPDGAVELYHDGSKKLHTNSGGVEISGHAYFPDNNGTHFGAGEDFKIYHNGSNSYIDNDTGNLYFRGSNGQMLFRPNNNEDALVLKPNGAVELYHDNSKKLETTSAGVSVTGALTASGNITAFSDVTLKEDINTISDALSKVLNLRGVSYSRKDTKEKGIGVVAQEIEKVLPEVVEDGQYKSVAYGNIVALLIEAIKDLNTQIKELKK